MLTGKKFPIPFSFVRMEFVTRGAIKRWAAMDIARLSLYTPVAIGVGAGIYFGLKTEPSWQVGAIFLLAAAFLCLIKIPIRPVIFTVMFMALGFVAADMRTAQVYAPQLTRDLGIVEVTGRLVSLEESVSRRRFILAVNSIEGVSEEALPARARISWRGKEFSAAPGDIISLRAGLSPPPPPVAPGAFDFARQLYFQQIGAVGYAVSAPFVEPSDKRSFREQYAVSVENMRFSLFQRIIAAAPGEGGAIIAAIVTGKRDAISDRAEAALRDAGLAHLLAISGLHMGLATGLIFFVVRFSLAAIEPVALRYPIKKIAAAAALFSGLFYLVLSGGGWSARRAFIMTAIIFIAILVDRRALSLRNVAIAAVIVLLTTPEALFHPGFQMSFAAVTALIAGYEWMSARSDPDRSFTLVARAKRYLVALAATDTIAALATAPFALFHFNRVAIFSLPANMAAMPVMGILIVPFAVLALILTPIGLDGWAWKVAAFFMEMVLAIASEVTSWPGAVSVTPQWPQLAMLVLTFGGLWLCISRAPWRLAGLCAIPVVAMLVSVEPKPFVFVSPAGVNAAIAYQSPSSEEIDGAQTDGLAVFNTRRDRFSVSLWNEALGIDPRIAKSVSMNSVLNCDESGCTGSIGTGQSQKSISFIDERTALDEDCERADIVVAFFPVTSQEWRACQATFIDRRSVWRKGAHTIWINEAGEVIVKTVENERGQRPWSGHPNS